MNYSKKLHIAVFMGGWSSEREISLVTGEAASKALKDLGYRVTEIDVTKDIEKLILTIKNTKPDVILNMLHGTFGEDGCMQGLLEILNIPYSHSGVLASALAMDKQKTKEILAEKNILSPKSYIITANDIKNDNIPLTPPYVVKPNQDGSSFGVQIVKDKSNKISFNHLSNEILVEEYIKGRELTVTVMGEKALGVTEIIPRFEFYDFEAKYADGGSEHKLPADIPQNIYDTAMKQALIAHKMLGCRGITRSDFIYSNKLYFLEINTQPGMTPTSLAPEQAKFNNISFQELVEWLVIDALDKCKNNCEMKNGKKNY